MQKCDHHLSSHRSWLLIEQNLLLHTLLQLIFNKNNNKPHKLKFKQITFHRLFSTKVLKIIWCTPALNKLHQVSAERTQDWSSSSKLQAWPHCSVWDKPRQFPLPAGQTHQPWRPSFSTPRSNAELSPLPSVHLPHQTLPSLLTH